MRAEMGHKRTQLIRLSYAGTLIDKIRAAKQTHAAVQVDFTLDSVSGTARVSLKSCPRGQLEFLPAEVERLTIDRTQLRALVSHIWHELSRAYNLDISLFCRRTVFSLLVESASR